MIPVGTRWSLRWKFPHRVEVTIVALESDYILTDAVHRCGFHCEMPLGGETRYRYKDFATLFQLMPEGAIALPPAHIAYIHLRRS